jgi:hypothetical protein
MRTALLVIGGGTSFIGLTAFTTAAFQERVSTCETRLNSTQLAMISILEQSTSEEVKIAQAVTSKQIELATGVRGPVGAEMSQLFIKLRDLNKNAMQANDQMSKVLEEGCEEQRSEWFLLSILAVFLNSFLACAAFWLGLRVSSQIAPPSSESK